MRGLAVATALMSLLSASVPREDTVVDRPPVALDRTCSTTNTAINPCTNSVPALTNRVRTTTFTVQNKNTIENMNYVVSCAVANPVTSAVASCSAPGTLYVPRNSSRTIVLTWTTKSTPGTGTVTLRVDDDLVAVTGTVTTTVTAPTPTGLFLAVTSPHLQRQTPDSGQTATARFVLQNGGADSTGWSWTAQCVGAAIASGSCSPLSGTVGLGPQATSTVSVTYTATGAAGSTGSVRFWMHRTADATIRDSGLVEVVTTRRDSTLVLADANPGDRVEPDNCLTMSAGEGMAVECGALRATHVLPGVRTLGADRAPILLYNSQHAHPRPIIRADLTLPDTRLPDSVVAVLSDSVGAPIAGARGAWPGAQWRARSSRRIAVTFDGIAWPGGSHAVSLAVTRWYGASPEATSKTQRLWIVNRSTSAYGAGWWIAGLERILNPDGDLRWTGGDGATRRYVNQGGGIYVAPALERPDTIVLVGTSYYERRLPRGLRVRFDWASGLHTSTINRLGHVTTFNYVAGTDRLASIVVPSGTLGRSFSFEYDGTPRLQRVLAPRLDALIPRDELVYGTSTPRIDSIVHLDGSAERYLYDPTEVRRIVGRVNERGDTTRIGFDAAGRVTVVSLPREPGIRDTLRFAVAETRGLAGTTATSPALTYALVDGPRTDVGDTTLFWVDRWGAPTTIRNAVGDETQLERGDGRFPSLVTRLRGVSGQVLGATYTDRGRLASLADSATVQGGITSTSTYRWDPQWDVVTYARGPMGDSVRTGVDAANGNVIWREDGRGASTRANFTYYTTGVAAGLLRVSVTAAGVRDSMEYETALGNPSRTIQPHGLYTTITSDALGRVAAVNAPFDASSAELVATTTYDVMDRPIVERQAAPGDTVVVRRVYSLAGNLDTVSRRALPDPNGLGELRTAYVYDRRRRPIQERLVHNGYTTAFISVLDPAGNLLSGGRAPATRSYDVLNQMVQKVGADVSRYVYDEAGRLRLAFNPVARIARRYATNGTLIADELRIATRRLSERQFDQNVFVIGARYDLANRRVAFQHPQTVAPSADSQRVVFSTTTGYLDSVTSVGGRRYRFLYDVDGRIERVVRLSGRSDSVTEISRYDSLARRVRRRVLLAGFTDSLLSDTMAFTRAGKLRFGGLDSAGYTPLGAVRRAFSGGPGLVEDFQVDALGNRRQRQSNVLQQGVTVSTYELNSERVTRSVLTSPVFGVQPETTFYSYSAAGAVTQERRDRRYGPLRDSLQRRLTINTYDDEARLAQSYYEQDSLPKPRGPYVKYTRTERYRYDPLGRRVWREMIRDTLNGICTAQDRSSGCRNEVTRTVWDGAQVLYDIRARADTVGESSEGYPGNDTFQGRVGYTHGLGLDAPLELFKGTDVIQPIADWRGQYVTGGCPAARCSEATTWFPGANGTVFEEPTPLPTGPPSWIGELVGGQADGSGYQYKRNRYFDPRSGRFTQDDPIGLAGGLNGYGFGGGDPINFSDPFGLAADTITYETEELRQAVQAAAARSPSLAEAVESLEGDPNAQVFIQNGPAPSGGPGEAVITRSLAGMYATVYIDLGTIDRASRDPRVARRGGISPSAVIAHELAGHVEPAQRGVTCGDKGGLKSCAIKTENRLRSEMGMKPRGFVALP